MKETYIRFRCSEEEKEMIEKNAKLYGKTVTEYLLILARKDDQEDTAEVMLKRIGCTNFKEIISCTMIYKNIAEKSYEIKTDVGEVDFRIIELSDGKFSKIDYKSDEMKFNRNVNLLEAY